MATEPSDAGAAQGKPQSLRLWLNAFIPIDLEGAEVVKAGAHAGKTMLPTPGPVDLWFLTDERGFSNAPDANSRMHSEIELWLPTFEVQRELHCCDDTIQVDKETGEVVCRETASTENMAFGDIQLAADARSWRCRLHGATKNSCLKVGPIKVSPNLDYDAAISILWNEKLTEFTITFDGLVETYPAFELYASLDGGPAVTVFRLPAAPGTSPVNLAGPPTRAVLESAVLTR